MEHILTAEHITKDFSNHRALDDVSIAVPRGKVYGLLGPNGAGKTTLIRIINHITAPDKGIVTFDGHPLTADDVVNIGYLPEERGLYKKMKVGEQALFFARLKGLDRKTAEASLREWFERLEITEWWGKKVEELSKGMAQKVQFIVTVLHRPKLLIFDEPFSGFDPVNANLLRDEILRLKNEGSTVIFSTHNMASVEEICDNISLINQGRNILSGNVEEIRRKFSDGRYRLRFRGDSRSLASAIEPVTDDFEILESGSPEVTEMAVKLKPQAGVRSLIDLANKTVDICSINESRASMNDVFISMVKDSPKA